MVDTDPLLHPFTAGYEPLGGGAGEPLDSAPTPGEAAGQDHTDPAADDPPTTHRPPPGRGDHDFADRLLVDPDRGDTKG